MKEKKYIKDLQVGDIFEIFDPRYFQRSNRHQGDKFIFIHKNKKSKNEGIQIFCSQFDTKKHKEVWAKPMIKINLIDTLDLSYKSINLKDIKVNNVVKVDANILNSGINMHITKIEESNTYDLKDPEGNYLPSGDHRTLHYYSDGNNKWSSITLPITADLPICQYSLN